MRAGRSWGLARQFSGVAQRVSAVAGTHTHVPTADARIPLAVDPYRPTYHYLPPCKWMNDPNGLMFDPVHRKYHMMYQWCETRPAGTPCLYRVWGHAASDDLLHWRQLDVALDANRTGAAPADQAAGQLAAHRAVPAAVRLLLQYRQVYHLDLTA